MEQTRRQRKKHERKKRIWIKGLLAILVILLAIGATQIPKILSIFSTFDNVELETGSKIPNTLGLLILGIDNDGGEDIEVGHTDSITYIAANLETKKAYALPIYRDAQVSVSCDDGRDENINRIYTQKGIECLSQTVSDFLDLPIDNYAILTMNGFVNIVNELGGIELTPDADFCSKYGLLSKKTEYCFTKGEQKEMPADEAIAYIRDRANGSGAQRANRQVQLIQAIKNKCLDNMLMCYQKASPHFSGAFKTNIAPADINQFTAVFGKEFELGKLDVIEGVNEQTATGWTQFVDEEDKKTKTAIIRDEIFEGKT